MGEAGISALALRAFAKASPSLQKELELEPVMDRIATYLIGLQDESGAIANPKSGLTTYRTSIALMALAAYDATLAKPRFATQIGKARAFLVRGQFSEQNLGGDAATAKKNPNFGGWGYDEKTGTQPKADLSNSHFALEALKEAKQVGQHVDDEVWQRAQVFLQRCQNRTESNDAAPAGVEIGDDGGFMYDPALDEGKSTPVVHPDGRKSIPSYASITYAGLMSMLYANVRKDDPRVQGAHKWIEQNYTLEENKGLGAGRPGGGKQGLYYMFHTFAKAMAAWGEPKVKTADGVEHDWAEDLVARLASLERPDGSWSNDTRRWWEDDPVLCTCYAALALEIADVSLGGEAPPALQPYKVEEPPAKKDAKGGDKAKGSGAK
jgi:squalene-hopene/tetraprenyl-beta-curcumene cyclase